jgi:hypothetical protein
MAQKAKYLGLGFRNEMEKTGLPPLLLLFFSWSIIILTYLKKKIGFNIALNRSPESKNFPSKLRQPTTSELENFCVGFG